MRRSPLLARGRVTFDAILEATARLLENGGIGAITTNRVAEAAGINVATLYHYFPNKQAILVALFEKQTHERAIGAKAIVGEIRPGGDWRQKLGAAIDAAVRMRGLEPGLVPLRMAMRASAQLQEYDRQDTLLISNVLADKIVESTNVPRAEAETVAFCSVETIGALLDIWQLDSGGTDDRIVGQLKAMIERYLAPYFDAPMKRTGRSRSRRAAT